MSSRQPWPLNFPLYNHTSSFRGSQPKRAFMASLCFLPGLCFLGQRGHATSARFQASLGPRGFGQAWPHCWQYLSPRSGLLWYRSGTQHTDAPWLRWVNHLQEQLPLRRLPLTLQCPQAPTCKPGFGPKLEPEPGFNLGSTQVQPRVQTQVQPRFNSGLTWVEPGFLWRRRDMW